MKVDVRAEGNLRVTVIGQGYVGLPGSIAIAGAGHTVHAVETNPRRYAALMRCCSYIADVASAELVEATESGRFHPVPDAAKVPSSDVYLIATPTPLTVDRRPDLTYVDRALADIARTVSPGALVILESTVYPGALRDHVAPELERLTGLRAGVDLYFAYSPERVDPGRGTPLRQIPKLVSGLDERSGKMARHFYETVFDHVIEVSSSEVAEFAKLLENTFRYVNVAFVNELSRAAHALRIPFREVVSAASTKPFGFLPFHHGPGVGGHCLPNNVHYLNHVLSTVGRSSEILATAERINTAMPAYVVQRLRHALEREGKDLPGSVVLILGLAFKADVADDRNSPTYAISDLLTGAGAEVRVADPWVKEIGPSSFTRVELTAEECARADAVLLVTDHQEVDYDMVLNTAGLILDCRGRLGAPEVEQL